MKSIEHKISHYIGILYKLKSFLSKTALFKIYNAMIYPYLLFALLSWESTYPTYMSKYCPLQNKVIKVSKTAKNQTQIKHFEASRFM